mmetsp:Transcript_119319/g.385250  ORF Transcript_119319/g.385250 Transcript_119319/m.385250 type:complete len:209 (+) Transcript_119319:1217-1843(+)
MPRPSRREAAQRNRQLSQWRRRPREALLPRRRRWSSTRTRSGGSARRPTWPPWEGPQRSWPRRSQKRACSALRAPTSRRCPCRRQRHGASQPTAAVAASGAPAAVWSPAPLAALPASLQVALQVPPRMAVSVRWLTLPRPAELARPLLVAAAAAVKAGPWSLLAVFRTHHMSLRHRGLAAWCLRPPHRSCSHRCKLWALKCLACLLGR